MSRTPTPWIHGDLTEDNDLNLYDHEAGDLVAHFVTREDAAYASRAVNLHEELMELLHIVVGNNYMMNEVLSQCHAERLEAIAKSKGGKS